MPTVAMNFKAGFNYTQSPGKDRAIQYSKQALLWTQERVIESLYEKASARIIEHSVWPSAYGSDRTGLSEAQLD